MMKRFTKEQLREYCANRPPEQPNPNSEPHTIVMTTIEEPCEEGLDETACSSLVAALARIETLDNALRVLIGDIDHLGHWIPDPCRNLVNNALKSNLDKRRLWVQYSHEDEKTASVIQTADSEQEAREEDGIIMHGCCWYRYDIEPREGDGKLTNPDGPHYLTNTITNDDCCPRCGGVMIGNRCECSHGGTL